MIKLAFLFMVCSWVYVFSSVFNFQFKLVEQPIQPYVNEFFFKLEQICPSKMKYQPKLYTIKWGSPPRDEDWIGVCEPSINGFTIQIDKRFWDVSDEQDRRQLVYHELSHCILYKAHSSYKDNYMYPSLERIPADLVLDQLKINMVDYCND